MNHILLCCLLLCCLTTAAQATYIDNGDGTVTDSGLNKVWQQADNAQHYQFVAATTYCDALTLATITTWRLPTKVELQSLAGSNLNYVAFPTLKRELYWSGELSGTMAWALYFGYAPEYGQWHDKSDDAYVRCISLPVMP